MWVVRLSDGKQDIAAYGPMKNEPEGHRFAGFLTEEVDPARVEYQPPYAPGEVSSPVGELLDWRDHVKAHQKAKDARIRAVHARLVHEAGNGNGGSAFRSGLYEAAALLAEAWYGYAPLDGA
ncbi:hypothetical protein [Actinomadura madurae]|uniref:hypothetical protein n=1 Tax=Actinomadura madurae TaxID=1993 RepID=UPI0020D25759|nr:hypothetical protein [Actinomadura madurae]MCP9947186.1 hypothetical protein [Actinomadura madurae]MCP9963951.1 hypothetical protein [Actinomadura madurae]MCP9976426.1 hypothetical protein [Actinomadura madurae]MCQ0012082.1 hypothetical protein [Actinomadura madurae]MCQ0012618.1 hypothetical protein [Actinomadura madurae]